MTAAAGAIDSGSLVILLGVAIVFALVIAAAFSAIGRERRLLRRRVFRLANKRADEPARAEKVKLRLDQSDSSIKGLDTLIKRYLPNPAKLRERLAKTGRAISPGEYLLANLLVGAITFLALDAVAGLTLISALLLAIACGLWLPHAFVNFLVNARLKRFTSLFPDAIDLIVRGLKSGLPVTESIKAVGDEMPDPIGVEFRKITDSFAIGQTMEQALWSAASRLDTTEFRFFVISLAIQQETGGNLAETLENLATILRRRKQMKLKIRALSGEARASATIIGVLPFAMFAMLYLVNPDYVRVLIDDPRGRMMLGGALVSLFSGVGIMLKMSKFEI